MRNGSAGVEVDELIDVADAGRVGARGSRRRDTGPVGPGQRGGIASATAHRGGGGRTAVGDDDAVGGRCARHGRREPVGLRDRQVTLGIDLGGVGGRIVERVRIGCSGRRIDLRRVGDRAGGCGDGPVTVKVTEAPTARSTDSVDVTSARRRAQAAPTVPTHVQPTPAMPAGIVSVTAAPVTADGPALVATISIGDRVARAGVGVVVGLGDRQVGDDVE